MVIPFCQPEHGFIAVKTAKADQLLLYAVLHFQHHTLHVVFQYFHKIT